MTGIVSHRSMPYAASRVVSCSWSRSAPSPFCGEHLVDQPLRRGRVDSARGRCSARRGCATTRRTRRRGRAPGPPPRLRGTTAPSRGVAKMLGTWRLLEFDRHPPARDGFVQAEHKRRRRRRRGSFARGFALRASVLRPKMSNCLHVFAQVQCFFDWRMRSTRPSRPGRRGAGRFGSRCRRATASGRGTRRRRASRPWCARGAAARPACRWRASGRSRR